MRASLFGRPRLFGCALASTGLFWAAGAEAAGPEPRSELPCPQILHAEARSARTWRYSWSAINAGLMVGSFAVVPLVEKESRPDWIVSGAGSGIAMLATWFFPLRVESASDELSALPVAQCQAQLPRLWLESEEDERARVTWPWHVINFGLSAGAGAIIAFGYRHYASGIVTTVAGTALGEVQILTQPTGLVHAQATSQRPVPRLAFTPANGGLPAAWTLSVASAF